MTAKWLPRYAKHLVACLVAFGLVGTLRPAAKAQSTDGAPVAMPPPLDPVASLKQIYLQPGYSLQLMAAEPLVADPVAIDWGPDGRLWVVEMADYPYGMDGKGQPGGRIRFLEDTNDDGLFDRSVVFLDKISFPTGVMPWRGGVLVTAAPELFFAEDTDGDGKADRRDVLFRGFMEGNQQLRVNGLRYGIDNWVYCAAGGHHAGFGADNSIVIAATGERVRLGSRDFRFRPDTHQFDPQSGPSQFGRIRDDWGNWFGVQNSHPLWHYVLQDPDLRRNPDGRYGDVRKQLRPPVNPAVFPASIRQKRYHSFEHSGHYTSACGPCIYRDNQLSTNQDLTHAFTCEPVSNVVQRHELQDDGVSFQGQRAATRSPYDFFASADRWTRPVMARTGPDGALWIVDMYRFIIEHPDWLPQEARDELEPFFRSGEGKGRIYRVFRTDSSPPRVPVLSDLTNSQLVERLASSNGPVRDLAQRLLIERNATEQRSRLQTMLESHASPRARLHALATLDGLESLDGAGAPDDVAPTGGATDRVLIDALRDPHPMVRRHALRLAETRAAKAPDVRDALLALADDESDKVRLQLVLSLGWVPGDEAADLLLRLASESANNQYLSDAFVSSIPRHLDALVNGVSQDATVSPKILVLLLESTADRPDLTAQLLRDALPSDPTTVDAETLRRCSVWLGSVHDRGKDPFDLSVANDRVSNDRDPSTSDSPDVVLADAVARLDRLMARAWQIAGDAEQPEAIRGAALHLVQYDRLARRREQRELLLELFSPELPSSMHVGVARILVNDSDSGSQPETVRPIFDAWTSLLPKARSEVLDLLWGDTVALGILLDEIENGQIGRLDLDAVRRDRLLHHPNEAIASRSEAVFASEVNSDRAAVLQRYALATTISGDAQVGEKLFTKHCATCHSPAEGPAIGPELRSLSDRSPASLLVSILDPSRTVDPRYLGYHAELKSGRVLFGLIIGETGNALRLRPSDGPTRTLLRSSIEQLESSRRSFMPEGFEAELTPRDVSDLISFVQQIK